MRNVTGADLPDQLKEIKIRVIDKWTDKPINKAKIEYNSHVYLTDSLGHAILTFQVEAKEVLISKDGFFTITFQIDLTDSSQIIYLEPILQTEAIVVAGTAGLSQNDISAGITGLSLDDFQYADDASEVLSRQSAVFVNNYGGQESIKSVAIRGLGSEQTLVLFEGIPLNRSQTGSVDPGRYAADFFTGAEIYRGGFSTIFGTGAVGGVVNLNSGHGDKLFRVVLEKGAYGASKMLLQSNATVLGTRHTIHLRRNYSQNHYNFLLNDESGIRQNSDFSKTGINYLGTVLIENSNTIDLHILWNKFKNGSPYAVRGTNQGLARIAEEDFIGGLSWQHLFTENITSSATVYLHRNWLDYDDPVIVTSQHYNQDTGVKFNIKTRLYSKMQIYAGIDGRLENISSSDAGDHQRIQGAVFGLFAWDVFSFREIYTTINLALRQEFYSDSPAMILPRVGITMTMESWRFYISAGKNHRIPTLNELYWRPGGNTDLNPETSIAFEAGLENQVFLLGQLRSRLGLYHIAVDDMIRWSPGSSGYWQPRNLDKVESRGFEIEMTHSSLNNIIEFHFNYKYGLSKKIASQVLDDPTLGNRLAYIPATELTAGLAFNIGSFNFGGQIYAMSYRYATIANLNDNIMPGVSIVNLNTAYELIISNLRINIYGKLENLFKKEYQFIQNYPVPLQAWKLGFEIGVD